MKAGLWVRASGLALVAAGAWAGQAAAQVAPTTDRNAPAETRDSRQSEAATDGSAATQASGVGPENQDDQLDNDSEVVVTATRREQRLEDVPIAIQAFSGEELEKAGVRDLTELIDFIPGASEGRGNAAGIQSYQIRGVSSFYGDSTIGYYLDEAAYVIPNRNYAPVARTFDVERVEVLRGPQGTLYGLGSMGGTIRFITADPDLDGYRQRAAIGFSDTKGGRNNFYTDIATSVPIIPGALAIRGSLSNERRGGFATSPSFPNDLDDDHFENYRVKLLGKIGGDFTIKLGLQRNETEDDWGRNFATTDPAAFPASPVQGRNRQVYDMYTAFFSYDVGPLALESSTGYIDRTDRSRGPVILGPRAFRLDVLGTSESLVQELRAVSQFDGPFQFVLGGIYQDAENLEDIVVTGGPPISAVSVYDSKSYAVYGEASYALFDNKLRPLIGLRYFHDNRDFTSQNRAPRVTPAFEANEKFDSVNPRFNLSFEPGRDFLFYVNAARGFRSGTFNTAAAVAVGAGAVDFAVTPDSIWSYEIGAKMNFFGRRLFLELAAYKFDWNDVQLNYTVAGGVQIIRNAGAIDGTGFDYGITWRPVDGLSIQASGNINSTKLDRLINPAAFAATPLIAEGRQLASVPKNDHSIGATFTTPLRGEMSLFLNGSYSYIGRQTDIGIDRPTITRLGGAFGDDHHLVRARVGLDWDRYGIFLFGENLLNDNGPIQVSGSGQTRYYPRVLGVELKLDY